MFINYGFIKVVPWGRHGKYRITCPTHCVAMLADDAAAAFVVVKSILQSEADRAAKP